MTAEDPKIPKSILNKIFDSTGSKHGGNKGYFLFFVNEDGIPTMTSRVENPTVSLALRKVIEMFAADDLEDNAQ
ncbi:hypothetical protein N9955_00995 [bacterium]|nr:hypothetical protein [bacterium]